ncbi:hypothetical protein AVEN_172965-1 [Araneus ventricosus]|uniref:Uncharacterized protein n=1 Tax=Araneus ventricosus TaxID=182803 RepID=A0A4Y2FXW9_ARAVE|nr:hypothetical protein AVEN_172965-1 [Araneus ventricosus]
MSPCGVEVWKGGLPTQVSSSSSDRGSKLRGPSQNRSRVGSKRDANTVDSQLTGTTPKNLQRKILDDLRKLDCSENVDEEAVENRLTKIRHWNVAKF